ncbi:uncharacterized protein LOC108705086 isoform X2 [Xenopus laevis]|uniref:long-chain-fatty-acid--CoA ligase n=2 Tax=Xenopus laevis TaxID=8355 RepID=A0A8J1M4P3_XENLA|nr:uncharacterized protein LOC108705086 isoform X2 [Xenopus laevis]
MASLETTQVQYEAPSDSFVEISEMEEAKELSHRATGDIGQEPLQESAANEKIEVSQESPWSFVDISESGECKEPEECATKAEMLPYRGPGESNETTSSFMVISECGETKNASPETKREAENETTSERGNVAFLNSTNSFVDLSESEEMREPLKESTREDEFDASEKATSDQVHAQYKQRTDSFAIFCEFEDNINLIPEATHEDLLQEATSEDASQEPTSNIYKERKDKTEGVVFQNQQKSQRKGPEDGTDLPHMVMCDFEGVSMESEAQLTREAHWSEYEATTIQRKEMSQETIYTFTDITTESKTTAEQLEVFTSPTHEPHHEASALHQLQYEATMKEYKGRNKVQPKKVTVEQLHKSPKEVTTEEDIDLTHESTCTCNDVTTNIERNNEPEQTMESLMAAGLNVFPKATMALQLASDCKKGKEQVKENICQDEYRSTLAVTMERGADMTNKQYCTAGTNFESRKETHQNVTGEIPNQNIINPTNEDRNKLSEWEAIAVQLNVSEWPQEDTNKKVKRQPDLGNTQEKPKKKKANAKGSDPLGETEESHPGTVEGTNKEQHEELARLIVWDELKGKLQYLAQEENKKEPTRRKVQVTESDKEEAHVAQREAQGGRAGSTGPFYYGWSGNAQLLAPAQTLWTVQRDGAVRLRMESSGAGSEPPLTVAQLMADAVRWFGQQVALCVREAEEWQRITYLQYGKQCRAVSKGLIRIGLERFHGALILGKNSPEWFMAEVGSIMAGGLAVVIDPLCTASECVDVALRTDTQVILLQDRGQLRKVLQVLRTLPHVKAIVQWEGDKEETHPRLYTWEELILLGMEVPDSKLDDVIASQKPNQCCAVFYTEDNPRGVMLSHDNLTWVSQTTCKLLNLNKHDVVISYLPLNQVAVQLFDLWIPLCCGGTTYFAEADALKKSLLPTLREVRPTRFLGLPWFWEKIQTRWMTLEEKTKLFPRKILAWGRGVGLRKYQKEGAGAAPWGYCLARRLVFHPVRVTLGLDRCSLCYVGTVPITHGTMEYYGSLGLTLLNVYGMNESCGLHSMELPNAWRTKSSGLEIPGCRTRITEPLTEATGELCLWGRHVFMGYLGMEKETQAALDDEGHLLTSDLGRRDSSGFLYVTEWGAGAYERPISHGGTQHRWSSEGLYMEI